VAVGGGGVNDMHRRRLFIDILVGRAVGAAVVFLHAAGIGNMC
jgi:hypothetical protein